MSFNSLSFLVIFPLIFAIYYLIKKQYRYIYLCIVSVVSYFLISPKYFLLLMVTTITVFLSALIIQNGNSKNNRKKLKTCFFLCLIANLMILAFCKYSGFVIGNINLGIKHFIGDYQISLPFNLIVPLGISFYTFQMLGYLIDVYRGKTEAEYNFLKFLLFASFFPTITSGPIERSNGLLRQIHEGIDFDYDKIRAGFLTILWGYYEKLIVADMIHPIVVQSFEAYEEYGAFNLFIATILYSIELYADFSGYSHIAIGVANMLGFDIVRNFKQPYFATSVKDFWRRWHISLSTWLRDYLYIPLGGNRVSRIKLYRNIFITFLISGIWHGAGWCFIIWGLLHGLYQIAENATSEFKNKFRKLFRINENCFSYRLLQISFTFILVSFAWFFFRAENLHSAISMLRWGILNIKTYSLYLDKETVNSILVALIPLLTVDIIKEFGIIPQYQIIKQNYIFRWLIYILGAAIILILMIRNFGVSANNFIYAQF